jgi:8-oxo-dGTP pyrophosphatase MutT (NUDIX family)
LVATVRQAVRVVLVDENDQVLLLRHASGGHEFEPHWAPPGGGVDPGETLQAAAARELWEEVGFTDVPLARPVWTWLHRYRYQGERITQHETIFVVRIAHADPRGQLENLLMDGIVEARWWHVNELLALADDVWPHGLATLLPAVLTESLDPQTPRQLTSELDVIAQDFRTWAQLEAAGSSPIYERLALAVADSPAVLSLLQSVEQRERQPNLLLGALRWHDVDVRDPAGALAWVEAHPDQVLDVLRTRRTQTNEVARCATLLPALSLIAGPIALIEVGASAGLNLLYDAWRYHYTGAEHWVGPVDSTVTLTCAEDGPVPLPDAVPEIGWRAGLDLNPLDPSDPPTRRWLECLVWPEHTDRAATLIAALEVAAQSPPRVVAGDLATDLEVLLDQVPAELTPVVVHSATLAYVDRSGRAAFVQLLRQRGVHRVGAEGPSVLQHLHSQLDGIDIAGRFVVSLDDQVLGLAQPHGRSLLWL